MTLSLAACTRMEFTNVRAGDAVHVAGVRNDHDVVLILSKQIETFGASTPTIVKRKIADADDLADRIFVRETTGPPRFCR